MIRSLYVKEPLLSCYTSYGILFSILDLKDSPWIYNNFIQLVYQDMWSMYVFEGHRYFLSHCPYLNYEIFSDKRLDQEYNQSLKKLIIDSINNGQYLLLWVDRYYLPVAKEYGNKHHPHELFIYGYDDETDEVLVADNLNDGKFIFTRCRFDEINEGHYCLNDIREIRKIQAFKVDNEYVQQISYGIEIKQIINSLYFYLNSYEFMYVYKDQIKISGIQIFDRVLSQIKNMGEMDTRVFHLFYEHLMVMEWRVEYLIRNGYVTEKQVNLSMFSSMKKKALVLRNLAIKFNISNKEMEWIKTIKGLHELKEQEKIEFGRLLEALIQNEEKNQCYNLVEN